MTASFPDLVRVGLHVTPPNRRDNMIVASSLPSKVGKESDPEGLDAMRTGKAMVLREGRNFHVILPLHDASDTVIVVLGLTFKPASAKKESDMVERARRVVHQFEKQIPSKDALFAAKG